MLRIDVLSSVNNPKLYIELAKIKETELIHTLNLGLFLKEFDFINFVTYQ